MKRIEQTYHMHATPTAVWAALTDPKLINQWGGGPAEMSPSTGKSFRLWDGDIYGKNLEVVPEKLLVQSWSDSSFLEPSTVRFELSTSEAMTTVHLVHSGVPDDRAADIDDGWRTYYLGPL